MRWDETAAASDAIAAISSAAGSAARGIVRVSGAETFAIVNDRLAQGQITARRGVQSVRIGVTLAGASVGVPALALVMVGPSSFTAQDTVELLMVGQPALLAAVVDALCDPARGSHHARRANPGEFSARAYLNGTIDVAEAESIAWAIAAESDTQLDAARQLRTGRVGQIAGAAADEITGLLALVEAGIDFSDQEAVIAITAVELVAALAKTQEEVAGSVARTTPEESLRALPVIALRGATNSGKSSLFNALLGHERVVASPQAGSTRDAIVEPLKLNRGHEALLMDLPGIDDPSHALEEQMQELAHHAFAAATVQLNCVPVAEGARAETGRNLMTVWTKSDVANARARAETAAQGGIITSAVAREGLDELREALTHAIESALSQSGVEHAPLLLSHHRSALARAQDAMTRASQTAQACVTAGRRGAEPAELIASDLREALDALGIVAGHRTPDDVLEALFAQFCIGK